MTRFFLHGRAAVVTGGGAGIGRALVDALLARGVAPIVIVGRDARRLDEVSRARGEAVVPYVADLADPAAVARLVADLPSLVPSLSLLVNNAGVQRQTDYLRDTRDADSLAAEAAEEIAVNLTSAITLATGLLPVLRRQPDAAIVNVTSALALAPKRSAPVYCATKAALRTFTRALRDQCAVAAPGIRVVEAMPPLVDTDMTRGRGTGKISPRKCADAIVRGLAAGDDEIRVGRARLLGAVHRVSPALAYRIMRGA